MGNSFLFPIPKASYNRSTYEKLMVYIPPHKQNIPCIYITSDERINRLLILFHGNSEDIGECFSLGYQIHQKLNVDVALIEYPGYGIYVGEPDEAKIYEDAEMVLFYFRNESRKRYSSRDIFLFGRSLGSSPALYLSSRYPDLGGVILISPFTSIKGVVEEKAGFLLSAIVPEMFNNLAKIQSVYIPLLIIHGIKDELIPFRHSEELVRACPSRRKMMKNPLKMTHNQFELEPDIIQNVKKFFSNIENDTTQEYPEKFHSDFGEHPKRLSGTQELPHVQRSHSTFGMPPMHAYPDTRFQPTYSTGFGMGAHYDQPPMPGNYNMSFVANPYHQPQQPPQPQQVTPAPRGGIDVKYYPGKSTLGFYC
eukprot:TRINITY_DN2848_c0_g2_i2.p1 TRINITY_DN2848_c0_g2~~TRINITY_DN2848_c0_g2_i2.p1  ORF type:complete len:365 (+),score=37.04 TRINITY_DN2848_c0_g2_i2:135-1229(+)